MEAAGLIGINNTWLKSIGDVGTYGITDFNLCTSVGFYVVVNEGNTSNAPGGIPYGALLVIGRSDSLVQICFGISTSANANKIAYRGYIANTWTSWRFIYDSNA